MQFFKRKNVLKKLETAVKADFIKKTDSIQRKHQYFSQFRDNNAKKADSSIFYSPNFGFFIGGQSFNRVRTSEYKKNPSYAIIT